MAPSSLLVIGGARSGKSRYAQARAESLDGDLVFIATAQAFDAEMAERIAQHRRDRGPRWATVEAPLDLPEVIAAQTRPDAVVLVDCLTLWASNWLLSDRGTLGAAEALGAAIAAASGPLILVSNEVGLGIVPDNALARRFRDFAGTVNQVAAAAADQVVLTVAGLALEVKPGGQRG